MQFELLSKLMGKNYSLQYLILWMMGSIAAVMLVISYFLLKTTKKLSNQLSNVSQKHYSRYLAKLKKVGLIPLATEGAQDFANRAAVALPRQAQSILEIGEIYNSLRYSQNSSGEKSIAEKSMRMKQLIKAFKPNKF